MSQEDKEESFDEAGHKLQGQVEPRTRQEYVDTRIKGLIAEFNNISTNVFLKNSHEIEGSETRNGAITRPINSSWKKFVSTFIIMPEGPIIPKRDFSLAVFPREGRRTPLEMNFHDAIAGLDSALQERGIKLENIYVSTPRGTEYSRDQVQDCLTIKYSI